MANFAPIMVGEAVGVPTPARPLAALAGQTVSIAYPSRLEAMALDPALIAERDDRVYTAGQIDVTVAIFKRVRVTITGDAGTITLSATTTRRSLVRHAAMLMRTALDVTDSLDIDVSDDLPLRHCGLGSSSGTIAAVTSAINELYGKPLSAEQITRYCAQNHGEEIDGDESRLVPVQCLGGSAVCGNYEGGLIILAGRATPIFRTDIADGVVAVIGVPREFAHPDSEELMKRESENMDRFVSSGRKYGPDIAYRLIHHVLPTLATGSLAECKALIFDYRWNMGSIHNCSFVLPRIDDIAAALRPYASDPDIDMVSLSSVGPGFFALTRDPERVVRDFAALEMDTHVAEIHNGRYIIKEER